MQPGEHAPTRLTGGMDVGGTKIEAKLFGADWQELASRRIATPQDSYQALLEAIAAQFFWLCERAGQPDLAIGIGVPGPVIAGLERMEMANLPVRGRDLAGDLSAIAGRPVPFLNDCRAFTLSEARLGAGRHSRVVLGLVIGTGIAGGLSVDGRLLGARSDAAGEFGHTPLPATLVARHDLPLLPCGCGQTGCYETLISGPGLGRLAGALAGRALPSPEIASRAAAGDAEMAGILGIWGEIAAVMLRSIILTADPDCIVLGGGLSRAEGLLETLAGPLPRDLPGGITPPPLRLAQGGDSSGTRGAALFAREGAAP